MTTASTQRMGGHGMQAGQQGFAVHQATNRPEPNHSDNPPILFRLPDLSSAQMNGLDGRGASGTPPEGGSLRSETDVNHSGIPTAPPPAPEVAGFPPPPATAPSAVGDDFPPPPAQPQTRPFGESSEEATQANFSEADGKRISPAAETPPVDHKSKSVRQSTSAAPAGRNWMETLGSRLLLLLLLAAVAAAAIIAGRGTNPADDMRLAGKPEDLLAELGVQSGTPGSSPTTQQNSETANDDVVEPPLSYEDFIARSQAEEQSDGEQVTEEKEEPSDAEQTTEERRDSSDSNDAATKASDIADFDLALIDPNPANASASDHQGSSKSDQSAANETVDSSEEANMATPFANAETRPDAEAEERAPRVAEAPAKGERGRLAITEPRSISEPRTNQLFEHTAESTEADSDFDLPVNPYDENPYVAERASEMPSGNTNMSADSSGGGWSSESHHQNGQASAPRYDRTDMDQGVDWESLLPPNQPAHQASPPSNGMPGNGMPGEVPSHYEPQGGGLQPPANAPQQMQRDFAGPYSSQGAGYSGVASDPRAFAGGQPAAGNQSYGSNQGYGGNQNYGQSYGANQGYGGNQGYNQGYGANQGYEQSYDGNKGYGDPASGYAPPNGMATANQPVNPQAGQMSHGYPPSQSSPTNGYPMPQAGGAYPHANGQSSTQQAVSPYDSPRR